MLRSRSSSTVRFAAITAALALLVPLAGSAAGSLHELWTGLVGRKGILEEKACGYDFTLSSPTQSGNAVVRAVESDHVVLLVTRGQKELELVVPFARITLLTERS